MPNARRRENGKASITHNTVRQDTEHDALREDYEHTLTRKPRHTHITQTHTEREGERGERAVRPLPFASSSTLSLRPSLSSGMPVRKVFIFSAPNTSE